MILYSVMGTNHYKVGEENNNLSTLAWFLTLSSSLQSRAAECGENIISLIVEGEYHQSFLEFDVNLTDQTGEGKYTFSSSLLF